MTATIDIERLVGHRFPGGEYTIEHWENFLLTECTGAAPLPDGLVHPVALFHVPILGAGTSIAEMFALGEAESDFSIGIEDYVWEISEPLREDVAYRIDGTITDAVRVEGDHRPYDRVRFRFDLTREGADVARVTITWRYHRGGR